MPYKPKFPDPAKRSCVYHGAARDKIKNRLERDRKVMSTLTEEEQQGIFSAERAAYGVECNTHRVVLETILERYDYDKLIEKHHAYLRGLGYKRVASHCNIEQLNLTTVMMFNEILTGLEDKIKELEDPSKDSHDAKEFNTKK